jgi:DNA-binding transcriptional LysR family regulator
MDTVQTMKVFVNVAQRSSFAAAARALRLSPAQVTKNIAALEVRLGARLLQRSTRRVSMTEAGHVYLDRCLECLHAMEDADASVSALAGEPRGRLRVTAPVDFEANLSELLARFMADHPDIVVDLHLSNRSLDLVEEGIDLAVRIAPALEGDFVARPVALTHLAFWGAPSYLRKHGRPARPEDLAQHRNLVFSEPRPRDEWTFNRDGQSIRVKLRPVLLSNNAHVISRALVAGQGLAAAPSFMLRDDAAAGRIEPILLDWALPTARVFAVYPHRRFLSPKVSLFIEALRVAFGDGASDPWWPEYPAPIRPTARRR